jgi:CheY-like chemotaxis protein
VAHDLNNILSGLVSYPDLLLMGLPDDSPMRKPILTIQNSGEKAASIVQDMLTLARRGVAVMDVVNINDVIMEYLNSPEHENLMTGHRDVLIRKKIERNLLNMSGSRIHLSKTVMNLVFNAVEAMPEGGIISISTENRYIDQAINGYDEVREGDYVTVSISDTGVGILPKDMERIFEPFYTKKVMGKSGTGLGMAVVWGTVKDHEGYIDVRSSKGEGTTFTLYFPVVREELSADKTTLHPIKDCMGKGESILVVDDVEEQREIASGMLKKLGYSATSVASGEGAVDYLKTNTVDLIVLDMIMVPGMDGLDTYKEILKMHAGQKAIITSGFSETARIKEAKRLGVQFYIKKPYLIETFGRAVRDALDG